MGHINHAVYGWVTPAVSYFAACIGALVALRSARWALLTEGRSRRNWLTFSAVSLGGGIWSMHFVAMLGFSVAGVQIRYDMPLTLLSLIVAVLVVGIGLFTVGYSTTRPTVALVIAGTATGLGVAAMHYMGMAAMRLPGHVMYDDRLVWASVGIAVAAATAALWAALNVQGTRAVLAAAPVMGIAVCAMHYTGMAAVSVQLTGEAEPGGVAALKFVFPLSVGLGSYIFISALAFAIAPTRQNAPGVIFGPAAPLSQR